MNSQSPRYEIRGATTSDEEQLLALAGHLDTVNLPDDRQSVRDLLQHAEQSFSGQLSVAKRRYVFLLWDLQTQRAIGSSSIIAQLGRRDAPYIYFDVLDEERYSKSLDKHFHHTVLRLGFSYKGPTELGGLVVQPEERGSPERLGRFVSYARFAYIAGRREAFRDQLLAELLPPLEADGTSHLWEALGRRFTGMSYAEADRLSSRDKDFIRDLFPLNEIHTSLFDDKARDVIGRVGAQTLGVERMLRAVGFRYARRVDPFDGGPHFVAPTEEVSLIQKSRRVRFAGPLPGASQPPSAPGSAPPGEQRAVILRYLSSAPFARSVQSEFRWSGSDGVCLPEAIRGHLELEAGAELMVTPLPSASQREPKQQGASQ
ncbi:MAG TPA: arginine N-succinyltransferase [Polyangiaceae bacterium]|nr:arginine N-succinyltransferase [Polyangiaceae bacterium]